MRTKAAIQRVQFVSEDSHGRTNQTIIEAIITDQPAIRIGNLNGVTWVGTRDEARALMESLQLIFRDA